MRYFGLALTIAVVLWDIDAVRVGCPVYIVAIFLVGHVTDYVTIGRFTNRASALWS